MNKLINMLDWDAVIGEGLSKLSIREKEIINLVITGFSSSEIADDLFISTHTVSTHRKNIKRKIGKLRYRQMVYASMMLRESA